jgi:ferredoxin-type protein NapF
MATQPADPVNRARRAFLRGQVQQAAVAAELALIAPSCLAQQRVECRVCGEACEAGAIRFRPQLGGVARPEVNAAACTAAQGCRDCVPACPVGAVSLGARPPVEAA